MKCRWVLSIVLLVAGFDENRLLQAIDKAEGSTKYPFGVKSVPTASHRPYARLIASNTIRNNEVRWIKAGKPSSYLEFLARRYCPDDWRVWKKNVTWFYNKGGTQC